MKRAVIMLLALLLCAACGRGEPPSPATLRADTTPESLIEELTQRYDLPESLLLQSAADLAALLQIKESTLLSGCGRIAIEEGDPCQLLLVQAAPGKAETATAALQKRLETVRQAFSGSPAAQSGQVITAGDSSPPGITPCSSSPRQGTPQRCGRRSRAFLPGRNKEKKWLHTGRNSCIII